MASALWTANRCAPVTDARWPNARAAGPGRYSSLICHGRACEAGWLRLGGIREVAGVTLRPFIDPYRGIICRMVSFRPASLGGNSSQLYTGRATAVPKRHAERYA